MSSPRKGQQSELTSQTYINTVSNSEDQDHILEKHVDIGPQNEDFETITSATPNARHHIKRNAVKDNTLK